MTVEIDDECRAHRRGEREGQRCRGLPLPATIWKGPASTSLPSRGRGSSLNIWDGQDTNKGADDGSGACAADPGQRTTPTDRTVVERPPVRQRGEAEAIQDPKARPKVERSRPEGPLLALSCGNALDAGRFDSVRGQSGHCVDEHEGVCSSGDEPRHAKSQVSRGNGFGDDHHHA